MNEINKNKLFGQIAIKLGYVTIQEIEKILIKQETDEITGIRKHIGSYLYEEGILTKEQISHILELQNKYIEKFKLNQVDDSIISTKNKDISNFHFFLHRFSSFNLFLIFLISIIFALLISYIHERMILEFTLHKLGRNTTDSRIIAEYIQKNLVDKPFDPYLVCSNLPVPIIFCLLISHNFNSIFIRSFFCLLGFLLSLFIYSIPRAIFWDSPVFALIVLHLTLIIIGIIFYKKIKINNNEGTNIIDKSSQNIFTHKFESKIPYEYIVFILLALLILFPVFYCLWLIAFYW